MSQTDVVVFGIKTLILDGTLSPGDRLPVEKDLATELAVSRSSLREGVRALSIMGVLETRQGAGTYVTSLEPALLMVPMGFLVDLQQSRNAVNLHYVRRTLETQAAQLAALALDEDGLSAAQLALDEMAVAVHAEPTDHAGMLENDMLFHQTIAQGSGNAVLAALIGALTSQTVRGRLWRAISDEEAERTTLAEHQAILDALRDRSPERAALRMANHLLQVEEFLASGPPEPTAGPTAEEIARAAKRAR